jgi:hypothetical protein
VTFKSEEKKEKKFFVFCFFVFLPSFEAAKASGVHHGHGKVMIMIQKQTSHGSSPRALQEKPKKSLFFFPLLPTATMSVPMQTRAVS